ncbi:hAT transposon superfamily [Quillaja saponaria]|uniref:HAT transposon superfamily n=1 Tax=Quillaja saponaria TaxID=32244 RepID=A0AAD7VGQ7_QUISA|nr:hAT transposon superfamily [Quillaja saponaria]
MEPTRTRNLSRTQNVKEGFGKFTRREKGPSREEIDPSIYRQQDVYQQKLKNMWNPKKWAKSAKHAIGKFFIYQNIAPNKAQGPYYQCMIDEIARAGVGVEGPTPYEIGGSILEDEIEELKEYIDEFKKKWEVYGVTLMCDGWTSITHLSITNFLIYCDGKTVFHKSVNTTGIDKDANYLFQLMDEVVQEIGEKYVVQIITDNQSSYKRAAELLMDRRPHLYWTSCAAHSLDLVLHDFAKFKSVSPILEQAKKCTNFIYNHGKVLHLMRQHCTGELIRPAQTRFATNYIALESLLQHKNGLQRMMTSDEWAMSASSKDPIGKKVRQTLMDSKFWERAKKIVSIHAPIAKVLRIVDGEKLTTMPYVYAAMIKAKEQIQEIAPNSCKKYIDVIDERCRKQIISRIHIAAYYLNPAYQYSENIGDQPELISALKDVVNRIEPSSTIASHALAEVKIFREAMHGFSSRLAVKGREKTDPAEWWFLY